MIAKKAKETRATTGSSENTKIEYIPSKCTAENSRLRIYCPTLPTTIMTIIITTAVPRIFS